MHARLYTGPYTFKFAVFFHMSIRMPVHVSVHVPKCMSKRVSIYMYMPRGVHCRLSVLHFLLNRDHLLVDLYRYVSMHMHAHTHVYTNAHTHVYTHLHTHVHKRVHTRLGTCVYGNTKRTD